MAKKVSGRRVYVTFLKDGTVAIHPSNCRGDRYRMRGKVVFMLVNGLPPRTLGAACSKFEMPV